MTYESFRRALPFFGGTALLVFVVSFGVRDARASNGVLLCHLHKKTDTIGHIVSVNENAAPSHLNHGDTELEEGSVGDECDTGAGCTIEGGACTTDGECCNSIDEGGDIVCAGLSDGSHVCLPF
ncbi:MAG: hypothetical protein OXU20_22120 [Myxococcales bacterium]|nr:hypothetical protein [Myxococcales bacterium]